MDVTNKIYLFVKELRGAIVLWEREVQVQIRAIFSDSATDSVVHDLTPTFKLWLVRHVISTECGSEHFEMSRMIWHKRMIQGFFLFLFLYV